MRKIAFRTAVALLIPAAVGLFGCRSGNTAGWYDSEFQQIVRQAGERVFPAVVYIRVVSDDLESGKNSANAVSGSGVLISADGELLTNYHVIDKAREIRCLLHDGSAWPAKIVGSDKDLDLALLRLERSDDVPPLPFAPLAEKTVNEGDFVMAMGAPWGLARSVSIGIISCANRYLPTNGKYTLWYQTDAAISPGNSGGPLVNTQGEVVGINTLGMLLGGAIGFTIPSPIIRIVLPRIREYGRVNWAWFGFQLQPLHDFDRNIYFNFSEGVMVSGTDPGSPARRAGFQPNDRIIAVNGQPVSAVNQEELPAIRRILGLLPFDEPVSFTVVRNDKTLTLSAAPRAKGRIEGDEVALSRWGFTAKAINRFDTPNLYFYQPEGVFVYGVENFGNAANARLMRNDIIQSIDGVPIKSLDELQRIYEEALRKLDTQTRVTISILRNGAPRQLVLDYLTDYHKEQL